MDQIEPAADSSPPSPEQSPGEPRGEWTWSARVGLFWAGVVVPVQCIVCGLWGMPATTGWQSGDVRVYAELLLTRPTTPFVPLLLYSMVSFVLLLVDFNRWSTRLAVRWGVYSGVLLAMQYFVVVAAALGGWSMSSSEWGTFAFFNSIALLGALVLFGGLVWFEHRAAVWALISIAVGVLLTVVGMVPPLMIIVLIFGTMWTTSAYVLMTWWLMRRPRVAGAQFYLWQLFGISGWFAAYCGAWRASYALMLAEYARLPTGAPGCYIATAAARGHRRIVNSDGSRAGNGETFFVNDQVRYFKAAELALLSAAPRVHRVTRKVYDRVGKSLAERLKHPWQADLAYLALKPTEWLVRALLPRFARNAARQFWR